MSDKDKIKDLFSSKLSNFEVHAPDSVWGGIEKSLFSQPIPSAAPKRNPTWIKIIAVAACLIVVLVSVYILMPQKENTAKEIVLTDHPKAEQKAEDRNIDIRKTRENPQEIIAEGIGNRQPLRTSGSQIKQSQTISNKDYADVSDKNNQTKEDVKDVGTTANQVSKIEEDKNVSNEIPAKKNKNKWAGDYLYPSKGHSNAFASDFHKNKKRESHGISLAVNSNASLLSSEISQKGGVMSFSKKTSLQSHLPAIMIFNSSEEAVLYDKDNNYDLDHKQPVTFGLTISKDITSRLSVETGITYTYLSSSIKSKEGKNVTDEKQVFHYLGIPVNFNYTFLQLGSAKFYVSLGGAIQKDVSGKYEGVLEQLKSPFATIASQSESNIDRRVDMKISQDHPQLSAHLNVGASYPIYKGLNAYGSVGGAYYFDADNEYRTIYSDKDTQLDINLGLKWSF